MDEIFEEKAFAPLTSPDGGGSIRFAATGAVSRAGGSLTEAPGRLTPIGQGRIKEAPVCLGPAMRRVASTKSDLMVDGLCFSTYEAATCAAKVTFSSRKAIPSNTDEVGNNSSGTRVQPRPCDFSAKHASCNSTVVTCSSASSCGRGAIGWAERGARKEPPLDVVRTEEPVATEDETRPHFEGEHGAGSDSSDHPLPRTLLPSSTLKKSFKDSLVKGRSSRQGRSRQRWLVHAPTDELIRQVAGCIPITRDGRILLVSASRKQEWILPKGGWDTDETSEECAVRETYEEAGVWGALGPCLKAIDYETRKAKKRRLERENGCPPLGGSVNHEDGVRDGLDHSVNDDQLSARKRAKLSSSTELAQSPLKKMLFRNKCSEKAPVEQSPPDPEDYRFVRLFLYPLFISEVKEEWPEKGRLRKLVDIDEAVHIMKGQKRPEFRAALLQVKERGLHCLSPSTVTSNTSSEDSNLALVHNFDKPR